jgi:hypothetical protein
MQILQTSTTFPQSCPVFKLVGAPRLGSEADGPARYLRDVAHPTETANEPDQADSGSLNPLALRRPYRSAQVMSFGECAAKQRTPGGE